MERPAAGEHAWEHIGVSTHAQLPVFCKVEWCCRCGALRISKEPTLGGVVFDRTHLPNLKNASLLSSVNDGSCLPSSPTKAQESSG